MYKTSLFLVAQGKSIDAETQAVSVFNILEDASAIGFPIVIAPIIIVGFLSREHEDSNAPTFQLQIELNNTLLMQFPMSVQFGDKLRTKTFASMQGLVVPNAGALTFRLKFGNTQLASYEMNVILFPPPSQAPPNVSVTPTESSVAF